jgi:hypothetical protein
MIDHFNTMLIAASTSNTASQTSVIVAITVAAIGAIATFTVGFLNFRTQRRGQKWQESQGGRQLELTLSSQMTDRFTKAIDQLGSEKKAVRIGGIFALERIALDSLKDENANYTLQSIAYTLATFVRESQPRAAVHESVYIPMLKIRAPEARTSVEHISATRSSAARDSATRTSAARGSSARILPARTSGTRNSAARNSVVWTLPARTSPALISPAQNSMPRLSAAPSGLEMLQFRRAGNETPALAGWWRRAQTPGRQRQARPEVAWASPGPAGRAVLPEEPTPGRRQAAPIVNSGEAASLLA